MLTPRFVKKILDFNGEHEIALTIYVVDEGIVGQLGQTAVLGTSGDDKITIGSTNLIETAGAGNDTNVITPASGFQFHPFNGGGGTDTLDQSA